MFVVVSQRKSVGSKILGIQERTRLWKVVREGTGADAGADEVKNIGTRRDAERVCGLLIELAALRPAKCATSGVSDG